jgi:outer membrane protein TolC
MKGHPTMRSFAATVLVLGTASTLRAQEPRRVTLAEALDLALQGQPTMVQARQAVRRAGAQELQATAAFLPSLTTSLSTSKTGGARINQFGVPITVQSYYSSSLGLSTSWELFTGFRRGAVRRQAVANADQADASLRLEEYAVALATKRAYYLALARAELVTVRQTRLRSADEQLRLTAERLRLGATTRSDSLRARVDYGNAQLALIQAQNDLRDAQAALGRVLQVEGEVVPVYDSTIEARVAALDTIALRRDARATAPSVRAAEAALAVARGSHGEARAAYFPTFTLSGGYNWAAGLAGVSLTPFSGAYAAGWNLRLGASYPLFNNYTRERNVINADAGVRNAEAALRDARLSVDVGLTQAMAALEAASARIDIGRVSVQAAEEDLRLQRERYRLGAVTIIEVLQSQANLDQAQVDLVQARYDYLTSRAQIEAIVGHGL